jgi:O-antigen ligase
MLGVIYAGCLEFFITLSPLLLYGTYVVLIGCMSACLIFDWSVSRNLRSGAPYLIWMLGYFIWAMIAISSQWVATTEGTKMFIKNFLLISSVALAVDRATLKGFAQLVQIGAIGNFILCLFEAANPQLIEMLAHTREEGATAYDVLRPAGLWSNPDEAATAFIFALLLGRWAGGWLAVMGRIAAVVGIYLGASRTGAYILLFCGLAYLGYWLRTRRINSTQLATLFGVTLVVGTVAVVAAVQLEFDPTEHWQLARILDFTEAKASASGGSRLDIAKAAVRTSFDGPWYGYGLFTFQFHAQPVIPTILDPPAHNIYLVVLGEAGLFVAVTFLLLLGWGVRRVMQVSMLPIDRMPVLLMWFCYLIVGLTWHNQFSSFQGMIYVGLLWHLPAVLKLSPKSRVAAREAVAV